MLASWTRKAPSEESLDEGVLLTNGGKALLVRPVTTRSLQ
jgi:hypothetical protein